MMVINALLYTSAVVIAILLVCLILVQPSKGGGLGTAFGGVGEGVFGAQTMGHLAKLTVVLITIFFVVTLSLAAISGHKGQSSTLSKSAALTTAEAPASTSTSKTESKASAPAAVETPAPASTDKK